MDDARHRGSDCYGEREESQQGPDGLAGSTGSAEVEGDGTNEGDEAAVEEPHDAAEAEEDLELVVAGLAGGGEQHGADTQEREGQLLQINSVSIFGEESEIRQFPEEEPAQTRGDGDAGEEDGGLAVVGVLLLVQGQVLSVLHQVDKGDEVTEESDGKTDRPDDKPHVPPVLNVDEPLHEGLGVVVVVSVDGGVAADLVVRGAEGEAAQDEGAGQAGEEDEAGQQPELGEEERTEEAEEDSEGGAPGRHKSIDSSEVFLEI